MNKPKPQPRAWRNAITRPAVPANKRISTRTRNPFYHTNKWKMHSIGFRERNPLCVDCKAGGMRTKATICDHEPPLDVQLSNGGDGYDEAQQRPRCYKCHQAKGSKDRKYFK